MNGLSWLIYLADVCDNIDWFFTLVLFCGVIVAIIATVAGWIMAGSEFKPEPEDWKIWRRVETWSIVLAASALLLGSVVPAKETFYAIAASELGETALNSSTGNKAVLALNRWLDEQIGNTPEPRREEERSNSNSH